MLNKDEIVQSLETLSQLVACPGREQLVADHILNAIKPYVDRVEIDALGNVIAIIEGTNSKGKKILLDAHMDEVGFMVSHIDEQGFIKVAPMGGIDTAVLPGTPVQFIGTDGNAVKGVFSHIPPHLSQKTNSGSLSYDDLSVDLGAGSLEELAAKGIHIGSYGTFYSPFMVLNDTTLMGKAFDNRCGCSIALHAAKLFSRNRPAHTIVFNFSVMEEYRQAGAKTGTTRLQPDIAIVIEGTTATDNAGIPAARVITSLGKGPALTIADGSHIVPQYLIDSITDCAQKHSIPWQYKKPIFGGTNAKEIATTEKGIPTAIVAVPCRYIHGPVGILNINDLIDSIQLIYNLCLDSTV